MIDEIMKRNGFSESENPNEFKRQDWTIRIFGLDVEIFNNPDKGDGVYYNGDLSLVDLEAIISEINELEISKLE